MLKKFLNYLNSRIFWIWLLFFSFVTLIISPENSIYYGVFVIYIIYYLIFTLNQRLFWFFITFVIITLSIYQPIYLSYGSLNSGVVAAFFETNMAESFEFLGKLKLDQFLLPFLFILSGYILYRLRKQAIPEIPPTQQDIKYQKILKYVLTALVLLSTTWIPTKHYFDYVSKEQIDSRWTLANSPVNLISFYANIIDSVNDYYTDKKDLESAKNILPPWHIISSQPKYKNYVLIIGESARRDYMSSYGFKLPTTPFLDKTNGYINAGYISAAPATYHSLLNTLHFKPKDKGKKDYSFNIITLAKAAGIKTFWLSNQGSIGKYDTLASRLGAGADFHYFTKKGGFITNNTDDLKLVDEFKIKLKEKDYQNDTRLFVIHLMGSHRNFCQRVKKDERKLEFINESLSCYVNSILKTDKLIEEIVSLLKSENESYSLIYFSDHGLSHTNKENKKEIDLDFGEESKQNFEVPFVKLSSDDTSRNLVNVKRSAFNFIYGYAEWLGIKTEELNNNYGFFSNKDDKDIKVFNFKENISYEKLKNDNIPNF
ncbi:sulfatase-like hydrolase/transferase [Aggregatibacter actinomycetemcomitans]|nr:sulfatase-like hydrolase/transferase [Aggregatibacter actinomycetemcomitans]